MGTVRGEEAATGSGEGARAGAIGKFSLTGIRDPGPGWVRDPTPSGRNGGGTGKGLKLEVVAASAWEKTVSNDVCFYCSFFFFWGLQRASTN